MQSWLRMTKIKEWSVRPVALFDSSSCKCDVMWCDVMEQWNSPPKRLILASRQTIEISALPAPSTMLKPAWFHLLARAMMHLCHSLYSTSAPWHPDSEGATASRYVPRQDDYLILSKQSRRGRQSHTYPRTYTLYCISISTRAHLSYVRRVSGINST
jgi:hypothetical protein